jgi:hypothetical protein
MGKLVITKNLMGTPEITLFLFKATEEIQQSEPAKLQRACTFF